MSTSKTCVDIVLLKSRELAADCGWNLFAFTLNIPGRNIDQTGMQSQEYSVMSRCTTPAKWPKCLSVSVLLKPCWISCITLHVIYLPAVALEQCRSYALTECLALEPEENRLKLFFSPAKFPNGTRKHIRKKYSPKQDF